MRQSLASLVYGPNAHERAARSLLNGGRAAMKPRPTLIVDDVLTARTPRLRTLVGVGGLLPVGSLVGTSGDADIDASIEKLLRSR